MAGEKVSPEVGYFLELLDEGYQKAAWHGPNLRGALRGVTAVEAAWRPEPGRHNIWELALHAAYWKYVVRRRLTGEKRGSFPMKGSDWFVRPADATDAAWKGDLELLEREHQSLIEAVRALIPGLVKQPGLAARQKLRMVRGAAFHDIYHAGQIRLVRRMAEQQQNATGRARKASV